MANVVKYRIFVKDGDNFATGSNLETCLANYLAFLSPIVDDFIWQNEPFFLHAKSGKGKSFVSAKSAEYLATELTVI